MKKRYLMLILYVVTYGISILFSRNENYVMSGLLLYLMAAGLYVHFYMETKRLFNLQGLLSFFWNFGIATACLKLSHLSADWSLVTWLAFLFFYLSFLAAYDLSERRTVKKQAAKPAKVSGEKIPTERFLKRVFLCICGMTLVSAAAFTLEAVVLGFIPMLIQDTPHAYSEFHLTGVHYFTVSSVMVHPLTVIYVFTHIQELGKWPGKKMLAALILLNGIAFSIPFLCVSRYFMIMSIALTMIVFISMKKQISMKLLVRLGIGCVVILVPAYLVLTVFRSHSVSYLNEIFEMKNENMPIFITQPYMYVANNFENFNCMVENLTEFKMGLRQLFPVLALTGLKFVVPGWMVSTAADFVTKTELTTVTILYDAYYDFGILGVVLFGVVLGMACQWITYKTEHQKNPIAYLFYGQIAMYLVLSFFTTWFSNPTTWFWLAATGAMYLFTAIKLPGKWLN